MTNDMPSAYDLLRAAATLAQDPRTTPNELNRARLLLDIAHELREDMMRRNLLAQQERFFRSPDPAPINRVDEMDEELVKAAAGKAFGIGPGQLVPVASDIMDDAPVSAPIYRDAAATVTQMARESTATFGDTAPGGLEERYAGSNDNTELTIMTAEQVASLDVRVTRCRHDHTAITWHQADGTYPAPGWYHDRTGQMVCPGDLYPHTFAEPVSAS